MSLDTTPLSNAIDRLAEGLRRYNLDTSDEQIRDGLIQRFEFVYEASHKMLRRYLEQTAATPDAFDMMVFADVIRSAGAKGLLRGGWPEWRRFREMRARMSHAYDASIAIDVGAGIPEFLAEALHLLAQLKRRLP